MFISKEAKIHLVEAFVKAVSEAFSDNADKYWPGYGRNFENNVFLVHAFCWCDDPNVCEWCSRWKGTMIPNFWHVPSNYRLNWYKCMGRDDKMNEELENASFDEVFEVLVDCYESVYESIKELERNN